MFCMTALAAAMIQTVRAQDVFNEMSYSPKQTVFKLNAPTRPVVRLYNDGMKGKAVKTLKMKRAGKDLWTLYVKGDLRGKFYTFDLGKGETPGVFAKAVGVNGNRGAVINLRSTDPEGWQNDRRPALLSAADQVIYEMHVRDFTHSAPGISHPDKFLGVGEPVSTDYLKRLGVTAVHLLPSFDYASVDETIQHNPPYNWGYDPKNYNVPEGSYSTDPYRPDVRIREFKQMVQALHKAGLRVILDVVYNHTFDIQHSNFQLTYPDYYYRKNADGTFSNGSGCGNETASEKPLMRKFMLESVKYWINEYHIDGFRFDLMGLLDVDLMNRIRKELDLIYGKGKIIIYGEPWAADKTAIEGGKKLADIKNIGLLDENIGAFCDSTRDGIKGSALISKKAGFINGAKGKEDAMLASVTAWCFNPYNAKGFKNVKAPSQIITYVSAHDNHTLWDKLKETVPEDECMRLNKMAAAIYMTCQGTLFFLSGEEFARTKNGEDNTFEAPISLNRLDWELAWKNKELVSYYRGLIALRKQLPGLCDKSKESYKNITDMWKQKDVVGFSVNNGKTGKWNLVKVIYNASKKVFAGEFLESNMEILCDENESFCTGKMINAGEQVKVAPQSVLILGQK